MPNITIMDASTARKFHKFSIGDQVVFRVTGAVDSLSNESVTIVIDDLRLDNEAKSVQEAARRAMNELHRVEPRVEPSIG